MKISYFTPYQKTIWEHLPTISLLKKICFLILVFISQLYSENPEQSIMDINNFTLWVSNNGFHDWIISGDYCGVYPKGTTGGIFTEGIVWGGKVYDGGEKIVRVNGCTYSSGNSPITRLYRVRTDYFNANLTDDAANFFRVPKYQVNDSMITALYNQYEKDWNEWPADKGAPFFDIDKDNKYKPDIDIPGVPGAPQTIWINYNDSLSERNYGSPPIGLDVRETYWAYAYTGILGNVIYKKVDIIYKGTETTPYDSRVDSMYICQFVDIDDGIATNDFVGCDTSLNLGYIYNSTDTDSRYNLFFPAPPAFGYSILNGAAFKSGNFSDSAIVDFKWRHYYKYFNSKPMTIYIAHRTGGYFSDPTFDYIGALEFYNLMRGYLLEPHYPSSYAGGEFHGLGTYMLNGDPVAKEGLIDGINDTPGDRRFWAISGSVNIKFGDTIEVVYAIVGGLGDDHLSSITDLRYNTKGAITEYNNLVNDITSGEFAPVIRRPLSHLNPDQYILHQNYPNPFNSSTIIKYELPDDAHVKLVVYDILGRIVKTLVDEERTAGRYEVKFNAGNLASGIYFCRISFNNLKSKLVYDNLNKVNKLIIIK